MSRFIVRRTLAALIVAVGCTTASIACGADGDGRRAAAVPARA